MVDGPSIFSDCAFCRRDAQLLKELDRALTAHELIKVRVGTDDRDVPRALGDELASATDAAVIHRVGKVLILWRPRPLDASR